MSGTGVGHAALPGTDGAERAAVERLEAELASRQGSVALLVTGSHARGTASPDSDLDLVLVAAERPEEAHRTVFLARRGRSPLHVSIGTTTVDAWLERADRPEAWALGFPARFVARYVWSTGPARVRLGAVPDQVHPPAPPELEDLVEALQKARRAIARADGHGAAWHARDAAELMPRLLVPLNPHCEVHDRREALAAALDLPSTPAAWGADLPVALGLTDTSGLAAAGTALELGLRLLAHLRTHAPGIDPQPGVAEALADGTLERLLGGEPAQL